MVIADDLRRKFDQPRSLKGVRTASPNGGRITPSLGLNISRDNFQNQDRYFFRNLQADTGHLFSSDAARHATLMDDLFIGLHAFVKYDRRWQHMYSGEQRNFQFLRRQTGPGAQAAMQPMSLFSYPCHYCGIILPEEFIEVDHQQPQAHPAVAVLKILHSLGGGYTYGAAAGVKGTHAGAISAAPSEVNSLGAAIAVSSLPKIQPAGKQFGQAWQSADLSNDPAKLQRYELTDKGKTFLTLCCMYWGESYVETMCLNSILNLVPACRLCNGASGKGAHPHATVARNR